MRSNLGQKRLGLLANALALGTLIAAYVRLDDVEVEGAYFNRSVGKDSVAVSVSHVSAAPWVIASAVLLVVGTLLLLSAYSVVNSAAVASARKLVGRDENPQGHSH